MRIYKNCGYYNVYYLFLFIYSWKNSLQTEMKHDLQLVGYNRYLHSFPTGVGVGTE